MLNVGVIGCGYWGPNIVRNFSGIEGAKVTVVCDKRTDAFGSLKKSFPHIELTTSTDDVIKSPHVDIVAIVTPVSTHYELAKQSLLNGKHVFVEKPMTYTTDYVKELIEIANQKSLVIMVDHTFLFTGAVKKIKELIQNDFLGKIYYYDSTRINLGLFQHDVNVLWDLATHDFSIMDYLINERPESLSAIGTAHINNLENLAFVTIYFQNNLIAHFNVNWLSPVKVRTTLIGGEKKMLLWNDVNPDEKLRIYDKGVTIDNRECIYNLLVNYRSGDMWVPRIDGTEALNLECKYLIKCIEEGTTPINDGLAGLRVVELLEACNESLRNHGKLVKMAKSTDLKQVKSNTIA